MLKIVIYGLGEAYRNNITLIEEINDNYEIVALVDKNVKKIGDEFLKSIEIITPDRIQNIDYDVIFVTSNKYFKEIQNELIMLGIEKKDIFNREMIRTELSSNKIIVHGKEYLDAKKRKILIITTDMSLSGGILVSVYAAMALKERGYSVTIATPSINDSMLEYCKQSEITIFEKISLPYISNLDINWINEYDYVMVTVFQMIESARLISSFRPIIWWIHEPISRWTDYYEKTIELYPESNSDEWMEQVQILSVSTIAKNAFNMFYPGVSKSIMPFGIPDLYDKKKEEKNNKIEIVMIAGYGPIKGHEILFKALENLDNNIRRKLKLNLVGISKDIALLLCERLNRICDYSIYGVREHSEVIDIIKSADIVACTSYVETMSMTIVEGMMCGKVCIASSNAGVSEYIKNGENGFTFEVANYADLSNKIRYIVTNWNKMNKIKSESRKTYENVFSMSKFADNLLKEFNNLYIKEIDNK